MKNYNYDDDEYDFLVEIYMYRNAKFHNVGRSPAHCWPCHLWTEYPDRDHVSRFRQHGIIPRNWIILRSLSSEQKDDSS